MLNRVQNPIRKLIEAEILSRPSGPSVPNVNFANSTFSITPHNFAADGIESASVDAELRDISNNLLTGKTLTLQKGFVQVSASLSFVTTSQTVMDGDGIDVTTVFIQLKQRIPGSAEGESLDGIPASFITLVIPEGGVSITQPTGFTDADGSITASFTATVDGDKTCQIYVQNLLLDDAPIVDVGGDIPPTPPGEPFFEDDFAGLQLNPANGFTWGGLFTRVSVVSYDGYDCLRFRYGADANFADSNAELRFNMGREVTTLWLEYYIHIPSNFLHRSQSPESVNNKFYQIWRDTYSDVTNGTLQFGHEYNRTSDYVSTARVMARRWNFNSVSSADPYGDYNVNQQGTTLISASGPLVIGSWNQVRIQLAIASNATAADGIQNMTINGTLLTSISNGKFWNFPASGATPADCFLRNGYFMGWSNSGFTDVTDFHIRGVKFYETDPAW